MPFAPSRSAGTNASCSVAAASPAAIICDTGALLDLRRLVSDLRRGAFTYAPLPIDHITRAMEIDERYADLGLGLVDASIVALAEDLGLTRIATRDLRHFSVLRLRDGRSFELVVRPTDPDRS